MTNQEIKDKIFGTYDWEEDREPRSIFTPSEYNLAKRNIPHPYTVSYGTLNALFKSETVAAETDRGIPISNRELRVDLTDVALLTLDEYGACTYHAPNKQEYEAVWAAGNMFKVMGYETRLFIFKN